MGLQCRAAVIVPVLRGVAWRVDGCVVEKGSLTKLLNSLDPSFLER